MSLLSSVITKLRSAIGSTVQAVANTTLGGKLLGYADVRVKFTDTGFQGYSKRVYDLANKGVISDTISFEVTSKLLDAIKEEASKFSRTGSLVESLYMQKVGDGRYVIDSNSPYKSTWLHPDKQGVPEVSQLMSWMKTKQEFEALGPKEMSRVAYAIQKSFRDGTGAGSTGMSTLRRLNPSGERFYDFVSAAMKQIEPELDNFGLVFKEIR